MIRCPKIKTITRGNTLDLYFNGNINNDNELLLDLKRITVNTEVETGSMNFKILACVGFGVGSQECINICQNKNVNNKDRLCNHKDAYNVAPIYYKENVKKAIYEHNFILFVESENIGNTNIIKDKLEKSINCLNICNGKICFNIVIYGSPLIPGMYPSLDMLYNSKIKLYFSGIGFSTECVFHYKNTKIPNTIIGNTLLFAGSNPVELKF